MNCTIEQLILRVKDGDQNAFNKLYNIYKPMALNYARKQLHCLDDAENAVQTLFIRIWDYKHHLRADKNFNSYIFTTLRNVIIDLYKKNSKEREMLSQIYIHAEDNELPDPKREDISIVLYDAINRLSNKRRQMLTLNLIGNSYEEIAVKTSTSRNTVRNQLVKAKKILKSDLSDYMVY